MDNGPLYGRSEYSYSWLHGCTFRLYLGAVSSSFRPEVAMRADRVEVTWDKSKSSWLVRITSGEEVIRRHCKIPKDSDEQRLRSMVQKALQDEGYEPDAASIDLVR
jgi:hypothetical protein